MATPKTKLSTVSSDKPAKVAFNLDTFERENAPEPFVIVLGGRRIEFADPQDLDWQDLMEIDDPDELTEKCLSAEDKVYFYSQKIEAFKLRELLERFRDHYGLGSPGNAGA